MQNNLVFLSKVFEQVTDPRGRQGREHPLSGLLALTFLGLLAGQNYFAHIQYWAENHWKQLKTPLGFKTAEPDNPVLPPRQDFFDRTARGFCRLFARSLTK